MVVGLGEHTDSAPQGDLQMRLLQLAMRKVCSELQAALDVVRLFLGHPSTFDLESNSQEVLARQGHQVAPLT